MNQKIHTHNNHNGFPQKCIDDNVWPHGISLYIFNFPALSGTTIANAEQRTNSCFSEKALWGEANRTDPSLERSFVAPRLLSGMLWELWSKLWKFKGLHFPFSLRSSTSLATAGHYCDGGHWGDSEGCAGPWCWNWPDLSLAECKGAHLAPAARADARPQAILKADYFPVAPREGIAFSCYLFCWDMIS